MQKRFVQDPSVLAVVPGGFGNLPRFIMVYPPKYFAGAKLGDNRPYNKENKPLV